MNREPQLCPIRGKLCTCDPRCDIYDADDPHPDDSLYCQCDEQPIEDEIAGNVCSACGKALA